MALMAEYGSLPRWRPASQGNVRGGFQETGPDVATVGEFSIITNSFMPKMD